ncbi:DnaJ C-terminal domain-containing protein [Vibrio hangzhouensis]|uniref:DnaJ C-terminal domain-containing protein n=1 Tax=Vibrio hangzhouensis TaxID=462991 RepID=UPI001C97513F|nr:DnaJ C-terminal domain-containing protein [Vibrio hangzhouensis]MBY6196380.1 DnaJ domain-containing protein [Vibrio hangzhouensis]
MSKRDYYNVLGVSKGASKKDIKKAYKKLAMKHHPDKNSGDTTAEEKFKEVKEAYEVLTDKEKRSQYDQFGHAAFEDGGFGGHGSHSSSGFEDIFGNAFRQHGGGFGGGGFGGFGGFEDIFSQAKGSRGRPQKGQDQEYTLTVDLIETIQGAKKTVELPINGEQKKINVKIPAGIKDGEKIRYSGKGGQSINGGPAGDLLLSIATRPHAHLKRDENDLICNVKIDMVTAALGGEAEVNVLGSRFKLKIPAGTQTGRKFKITGKGVTSRKGETGNLLVKIQVETPTNLTEKQRDLLEQFKANK